MRTCDSSIMARMQMPPGVSFGNFRCEAKRRRAPSMAPDDWAVEVSVTGWGPTLHAATMEWKSVCMEPGADEQAAAFSRHLAIQMQRYRASRHLGFDEHRPRDAGLIGHMIADRAIMALSPRLPEVVEREIARLETLDINGLANFHNRGSLTLMEGTSDDARPRALLNVSMPWGSYDGATLKIKTTIPDTVIAVIAGRKVGDVLERGDLLDPAMLPVLDRTIVAAYSTGTALALKTEPDWVALAG